jgi:LEA14-like dessication related protein
MSSTTVVTGRCGGMLSALILILSMVGCTGLPPGAEPPTVTIADLSIGSASLFEQQFNLKLRIQNPNPDAFEVDGIAFTLELNDQPFAKGVGNQAVTVPRYGSALMDVEGVSTLSSLLRGIGKFVEKPALKYRIKGSLSLAGGARIPFDRRGEYDFAAATKSQ